jgi:hypothetical protein
MTTNRKAESNRRNARRSTGPKTEAGKARSSMNALKHGILARNRIKDDCMGKKMREEYDQQLERYTSAYQPVGPLEEDEVEKIALAYWRLGRVMQLEAISAHDRACIDFGELYLNHITVPGKKDAPLIIRYETMINRELEKAINRLEKLQKQRAERDADAEDEPDYQTKPNPQIIEEVQAFSDASESMPPIDSAGASPPDGASSTG